MVVIKMGEASKAASTIAESVHENQATATLKTMSSPVVPDQAFKPEYGLQCPISGRYFSEQMDGVPHIVCAVVSEQKRSIINK